MKTITTVGILVIMAIVLAAIGGCKSKDTANQDKTDAGSASNVVPTPSPAPSANHLEVKLNTFLDAVQHREFREIFLGTRSYLLNASKLKQQNPKALWEKVIDKYYEAENQAFVAKGHWTTPDATLVQYIAPIHSRKILETRPSSFDEKYGSVGGKEWYVQINYPNVAEAPFQRFRSESDAADKLIKEAVIVVVTDDDGDFVNCRALPEGFVYWDSTREKIPLRITEVDWDEGGTDHKQLGVNVVGGTPPYAVFAVCGGNVLQGAYKSNAPGRIAFDDMQLASLARKTACPNNMTVIVRDVAGTYELADLSVTPKISLFCGAYYVRSESDAALRASNIDGNNYDRPAIYLKVEGKKRQTAIDDVDHAVK